MNADLLLKHLFLICVCVCGVCVCVDSSVANFGCLFRKFNDYTGICSKPPSNHIWSLAKEILYIYKILEFEMSNFCNLLLYFLLHVLNVLTSTSLL